MEGQNVLIELRYGEGKADRLPILAAELVNLKVDVIVAIPNPAIEAVRQVTKTIPIVMPIGYDPVGDGFAASLARPGGNITGLSAYSPELSGKKLELLKEIVPKLSRVAVLRVRMSQATLSIKRDWSWRPVPATSKPIIRRARFQGLGQYL